MSGGDFLGRRSLITSGHHLRTSLQAKKKPDVIFPLQNPMFHHLRTSPPAEKRPPALECPEVRSPMMWSRSRGGLGAGGSGVGVDRGKKRSIGEGGGCRRFKQCPTRYIIVTAKNRARHPVFGRGSGWVREPPMALDQ